MASKWDVQVWVDTCCGFKGYGAWLAPLNWVALGYLVYMLFPLVLLPNKIYNFGSPLTFWGICLLILIFMFLLLAASVVFFKQAKKTAQRIEYNHGAYVARLYYGGKATFYAGQIKNIQGFRLGALNRLLTPLGRYVKNYKIMLEDGSYFCISGKMPGISDLIGLMGTGPRHQKLPYLLR